MKLPATLTGVLLTALLLPPPSGATSQQPAQSVAGVVTDAASGEPLPATLVSLVAEDGRTHRSVMTDAGGAFRLPVADPGAWRVQVSRLSYATRSEPVEVGAGARVRLDVPLHPAPIHLDAIAVAVDQGDRCRRIDPGDASLVVRLWEEARTALRVVDWAAREERYRFVQARWEREVDLLAGERAERRGQAAFSGDPFRGAPVDSLLAHGWVRSDPSGAITWYGPDAQALLSDAFRDAHCFGVEPHPERDDWVGVGFEPVDRGGPPRIEGVVWIDRESAALQRIDFGYTDHLHPLPVPDLLLELFGGWIEFRTLQSGVVVVDRWSIRMPAYLRRVRDGGPLDGVAAEHAAHFRRVRPRLPETWLREVDEVLGFGYREEGGEVLRIRTPDGTVISGGGG